MTHQESNTKQKAIEDPIMDALCGSLNVSPSRLYPNTHLADDLYLDAIDRMLLIIDLENRLKVYLTPEEADSIQTVQDLSFYFRGHAA